MNDSLTDTIKADTAVVIAAADRCAGDCLARVGEPCVRWTDVAPNLHETIRTGTGLTS